MDFYREKRTAFLMIDDLVNKGTPIEIIYFKISTNFGFTHKFVDIRIEELRLLTVMSEVKTNEDKKKK